MKHLEGVQKAWYIAGRSHEDSLHLQNKWVELMQEVGSGRFIRLVKSEFNEHVKRLREVPNIHNLPPLAREHVESAVNQLDYCQ
jgi:hypothetical protein